MGFQVWKMDPLKMYFLLNIGIFHCYVSLPDSNWNDPPSGASKVSCDLRTTWFESFLELRSVQMWTVILERLGVLGKPKRNDVRWGCFFLDRRNGWVGLSWVELGWVWVELGWVWVVLFGVDSQIWFISVFFFGGELWSKKKPHIKKSTEKFNKTWSTSRKFLFGTHKFKNESQTSSKFWEFRSRRGRIPSLAVKKGHLFVVY